MATATQERSPASLARMMAKVVERKKNNERDRRRSFWRLVLDFITGNLTLETDAELDAAANILDQYGSDGAGFEQAVEYVKKRQIDAKLREGLPALEKKRAKLQAEQAAKRDALDEYFRAERAKIEQLGENLAQLELQIGRGQDAAQRLYSTFNDPDVLAEEREHSNQIRRLRDEVQAKEQAIKMQIVFPLREAERQLADEQVRLTLSEEAGRDARNLTSREKLKATIAGLKKRKAAADRELDALRGEMQEHQNRLAELAAKHYQVLPAC